MIAIIDFERVVKSVYQREFFDCQKADIATQVDIVTKVEKLMRTAVSDLSKVHSIEAVLIGDADGFTGFSLTLHEVNKAISNPLVYHRHINLTSVVSRQLENDAKKQASR